jgi:hypothetical protein
VPPKPPVPPVPPPTRARAPHVQAALSRTAQAKPLVLGGSAAPPESPQRQGNLASHVSRAVQVKVPPNEIVQPAFRSLFTPNLLKTASLSKTIIPKPPLQSLDSSLSTNKITVDTRYGPMPGTQGKNWTPPTPKLKKLSPGIFGYFSPSVNKMVLNSRYSEYIQKVTKEHETAHAAHGTYLSLDTAEDLIFTEFVAWWRDALRAVDLADQGNGPKQNDLEGQQILKDARSYLKDPQAAFKKAMVPYHDQIREFLKREGSNEDPAAFVNKLVSSIQIGKEFGKLEVQREWE